MRSLGLVIFIVVVRAGAQDSAGSAPPSEPLSTVPAVVTKNAACLKCHEPISALLKKKFIHQPVTTGCANCHMDHQSNTAKSETEHYLYWPDPDLCSTCHDTDDKRLVAAHRGQPFDKATCSGCHNPHGSDNPKLIAANVHPPFANRQCDKCHQSPEDGKVRLKSASVSELCWGCHTQFSARYTESKVKHTFLELDENSCITCHRPHASPEAKLLRARVTALCTGCHVDKPGNKKFVHEPARDNCSICHDPHGSNYDAHLKADVNTLCIACHGLRPATQNAEGERLIMPASLSERATKIFLDTQNKGHPYVGHPVSGAGIDPHRDKPVSCISCHTPHSGNMVQRFVGELRGNALCLSCHGKK